MPLLTSKHEVIPTIMIIERQYVIVIISVKNQKLCIDGLPGFDDSYPDIYYKLTPECDKTNPDMTLIPPVRFRPGGLTLITNMT